MRIKIKIKNININNNDIIIVSSNDIEFISPIIKGVIQFNIYNENKKRYSLDSIQENDSIKLYYSIMDKKNIIEKVIINNKYMVISDDSDIDSIDIE
jgi:hypothetical protein